MRVVAYPRWVARGIVKKTKFKMIKDIRKKFVALGLKFIILIILIFVC